MARASIALARTVALAVGAALVIGSCGGGDDTPKRSDAGRPRLPPADVAPRGGLAIGLAEANPNFFWRGHDVGALAPWRERAQDLRPALYRLVVDWASIQPRAGTPPDWSVPSAGCARQVQPCRSWAGVRDTLRAIRSQQRAGAGFAPMVVIYGVPAWAARPPSGCERPGLAPRSRPITAAGLAGYRRLIGSLQALADSERVGLRWWAPWNEPNGPFFISPQRATCDVDSPALAPSVYATLARTMRRALRPGQQLVIGELAGFDGVRVGGAGIQEFIGALPEDVLCSAGVFSQHAYAKRGQSSEGPVETLIAALERSPCARRQPVWVTETGVGGPHVGDARAVEKAELRGDCRALSSLLRRWDANPRVDAAIQYTLRDDPVFPVGLADAALTRSWPTYALWRAWGGGRDPAAPPPPLSADCAG